MRFQRHVRVCPRSIIFTLHPSHIRTAPTAGCVLRLLDRHRRLGDRRRGAAPAAAVDCSFDADHANASANDADDNVNDEWNGGTAAGQL